MKSIFHKHEPEDTLKEVREFIESPRFTDDEDKYLKALAEEKAKEAQEKTTQEWMVEHRRDTITEKMAAILREGFLIVCRLPNQKGAEWGDKVRLILKEYDEETKNKRMNNEIEKLDEWTRTGK